MLDENLPAFFLKAAGDGQKHHREFYLSYHGSEPEPAYLLQSADPASPSPAHKNCYAIALFDAYNPGVLFGEVLARPGWTQPSLSAEELRKHGGIPPPPQPILLGDFTVQLYNPDQQIRVDAKGGKWGGSDSYEFSMPQDVFRTPSGSTLDRGQSDPASLVTTPRINFVWRKESKLNKDLTCFMTGKSTDTKKKSSRKDPDIAVALWRSMRELTLYEPNLGRIEMEDPKGLEVVLLLSAVVIKDLFFTAREHLKELFNVSDVDVQKVSDGGRKLSSPKPSAFPAVGGAASSPLALTAVANASKREFLPKLQTTPPGSSSRPPPPADPRAQWELDTETARLKAQADAEAREVARLRQARDKADELERRRLQRMVEEEEREAQRRQMEIAKETERLRKQYGVKPLPIRQQRPRPNASYARPQQQNFLQPIAQGGPIPPSRPQLGGNGLYAQPAASSSAVYMTGANPGIGSSSLRPPAGAKKKKSFFGLRSVGDDGSGSQQQRLAKKSSAVWR